MSYFLQTGDCVGVKFMLSFHTCRIHKRSRTRGQEQEKQDRMRRPVHPASSECAVLECSIIWAAPDHGILFRHSFFFFQTFLNYDLITILAILSLSSAGYESILMGLVFVRAPRNQWATCFYSSNCYYNNLLLLAFCILFTHQCLKNFSVLTSTIPT